MPDKFTVAFKKLAGFKSASYPKDAESAAEDVIATPLELASFAEYQNLPAP